MNKTSKLFSARRAHQITVFIDNKPGTLAAAVDILAAAQVNMFALCLNEGLDIGYLRITVDRLRAAQKALEAAGHLVIGHEVILLEVADKPGGFAAASDRLAAKGINIEYAYSANSPGPRRSMLVVRVSDVGRALRVLSR